MSHSHSLLSIFIPVLLVYIPSQSTAFTSLSHERPKNNLGNDSRQKEPSGSMEIEISEKAVRQMQRRLRSSGKGT